MISERMRHSSDLRYTYASTAGMENDFSLKKTMMILVTVVACFAVLWPSVFYPMLVGSEDQHIKPSAIDRTTGCCYVLSEKDVDTIKIMSELCGNIIKKQAGETLLTAKQMTNICQDEVMKTCGIDISAVLQEQVRLGKTTKDILDQIRSLNGSLCLKYNFGVAPWRLGVPHIVTIRNASDNVPQERHHMLRSEMVHPALLERGSAIPQPGRPPQRPKIVIEGRPPRPGSRPPLGAGAHGVRKQEGRTMGIIMPIYTVGIIIFFTYTLMKVMFRKHPDTDTIIYSSEGQERFHEDAYRETSTRNSGGSCTLVVNAMSALLDEVDHDIEGRRQSRECTVQDEHSNTTNMSNGSIKKEEKPFVKVMAMETSESCEGDKKWQCVNSSVLPNVPSSVNEHVAPPKEIFLDRALPPQSQILVADSATETEKNSGDDPAVVLAGKMTLSVISLENENLDLDENKKINIRNLENSTQILQKEVNDLIEEAVEHMKGSKLFVDLLNTKDVKIEAAGLETKQTDEKIIDKVDISKLLEEETNIPSKFGNATESEKLTPNIIPEVKHEENDLLKTEPNRGKIEDSLIDVNFKDIETEPPSSEVASKSNVDHSILQNENHLTESHTQFSKEELSQKSSKSQTSSKFSHTLVDGSNETPNEENDAKILSTQISNNSYLNEARDEVIADSKEIEEKSSIEASQPIKFSCEKSAIESDGGFNKTHTPLLNAKSSSEESGSTVNTASNPGSVVNVSTKGHQKSGEELDTSKDEESDAESEEEVEVSEEEDDIEEKEMIGNGLGLNERLNNHGNDLLINGDDENNEGEESDEEEEEIIEEYSEEEEIEDEDDTDDITHLASNGSRV